MLIESELPKTFWAEALRTAVFNRDRCPSAALDFQIPEEVWTGRALSKNRLSTMKVFWYKNKYDSKSGTANIIG